METDQLSISRTNFSSFDLYICLINVLAVGIDTFTWLSIDYR